MEQSQEKMGEEDKEVGTVSYHTYLHFYFGGKAKWISPLSMFFLVIMVVWTCHIFSSYSF